LLGWLSGRGRALESPFGGAAGYRVRGTLIALRDEQADQILIEPEAAPAES